MPIPIIQERRVQTVVHYELFFQEIGRGRGTGFGFPCDERGRVMVDMMGAAAHDNYERLCRDHAGYEPPEVLKHENRVVHPKIGKCLCGHEVMLDSFTNTCDGCGRDYNSSGAELAPREQWGEETGEHWTDIIRIR